MNIKKKAIQGVFWSIIQNWGSQAGSFLVFLILARLLTPEAFGVVALANVMINFMQILLEQGFAQVLIQRQNIDNEHINTAFWTQVFIGVLLTIISFITSDLIAKSFNQSQLSPVIKLLSIIFIIAAFSQIQIALLKRKFAFKTLANRALLGIFVAGIVGIYMAFSGYGVWSLVGQQLTYELVGIVVLWAANDWRPQWQFSWQHLSELLNFSTNILGFKLVSFFNQKTDSLLIGYFLGEVALGYYAIAQRILQVMTQLLSGTINQVALSTFSRLQTDTNLLQKAFHQTLQFTSLIAFPTFFGMIILTPELITMLFGQQWQPTIPIMQILAFAGLLHSISIFTESIFMAMNKPSWRLYLGVLNTVLNIFACVLAVQWGIIAIAIAYVISDYIAFPFGQCAVSRLIQIPTLTYLRQFIAPLLCSLIMVVMIVIVKYLSQNLFNSQVLLISCTVIGAISYGLSIRLLAPKLWYQLLELAMLFH